MGVFITFLFVLVDAILIQPIRVVVGFINRFLWHPVEYKKDEYTETATEEELKQLAEEALNNYDFNYMLHSGDCYKFLGMYVSNRKDEKILDYLKSLIDPEHHTFKRENYGTSTAEFSTDMLPGLMLVLNTYPDLYNRKELEKVCDYVTFNSIPFDFPNKEGKKELKRGWFFNPAYVWSSNNILTTMSWCSLCYKLFGTFKYKFMYYFLMILNLPTLIFACPHANVALPKLHICGWAWHQIHSKMIVYCLGYHLTKNIFFKLGAKKIYKLHKDMNPEIVGYYYKYILNQKLDLSSKEGIYAVRAILANNLKGTIDTSNLKTVTYLDIRKFEKVQMLEYMHDCRYRNEEYQWERNPQKKQTMLSEEWRRKHRLDVFNAVSLIFQKEI